MTCDINDKSKSPIGLIELENMMRDKEQQGIYDQNRD